MSSRHSSSSEEALEKILDNLDVVKGMADDQVKVDEMVKMLLDAAQKVGEDKPQTKQLAINQKANKTNRRDLQKLYKLTLTPGTNLTNTQPEKEVVNEPEKSAVSLCSTFAIPCQEHQKKESLPSVFEEMLKMPFTPVAPVTSDVNGELFKQFYNLFLNSTASVRPVFNFLGPNSIDSPALFQPYFPFNFANPFLFNPSTEDFTTPTKPVERSEAPETPTKRRKRKNYKVNTEGFLPKKMARQIEQLDVSPEEKERQSNDCKRRIQLRCLCVYRKARPSNLPYASLEEIGWTINNLKPGQQILLFINKWIRIPQWDLVTFHSASVDPLTGTPRVAFVQKDETNYLGHQPCSECLLKSVCIVLPHLPLVVTHRTENAEGRSEKTKDEEKKEEASTKETEE